MDTLCLKCIFSEWEGNVQTNCNFDRLEKLEENGAVITQESSENKTYFRIGGRFCNTCRDEESMSKYPARKWREVVTEQIRIRCAIVCYMGTETTLFALQATLNSILNQTLPPTELKVVLQGSSLTAPDVRFLMDDWGCTIPWEIITMMDEDLGFNAAIDRSVRSCKSTYYSICRAGYHYPMDFLSNINRAINDDMIRFIAIVPDENGNGLFIQTKLHSFISGNASMDVLDKIREIAKEEGTTHMIKNYDEICH